MSDHLWMRVTRSNGVPVQEHTLTCRRCGAWARVRLVLQLGSLSSSIVVGRYEGGVWRTLSTAPTYSDPCPGEGR